MVRPIMGRKELADHHVKRSGRDYSRSCDGFDDMDVARADGWSVLSAWGRDGWDLGNWPYVVLSIRTVDGKYQVQQVVEGDHDVYEFSSEEDRDAAIDYLFLWYAIANSQRWMPLTHLDWERLDAGGIQVDPKFRGPYSRARCEAENKEAS